MAGKSNQAKGGMGYVKGKLQWVIGKMTRDRSLQARGAGNEAKGGMTYEAGKAQGAVGKLTKK
jgi:uncharacterized protein YjbJ (UPF0337 family)